MHLDELHWPPHNGQSHESAGVVLWNLNEIHWPLIMQSALVAALFHRCRVCLELKSKLRLNTRTLAFTHYVLFCFIRVVVFR